MDRDKIHPSLSLTRITPAGSGSLAQLCKIMQYGVTVLLLLIAKERGEEAKKKNDAEKGGG